MKPELQHHDQCAWTALDSISLESERKHWAQSTVRSDRYQTTVSDNSVVVLSSIVCTDCKAEEAFLQPVHYGCYCTRYRTL